MLCLITFMFAIHVTAQIGDDPCGCQQNYLECQGDALGRYQWCYRDAIERTQGAYTGYYREVYLQACLAAYQAELAGCVQAYSYCHQYCIIS